MPQTSQIPAIDLQQQAPTLIPRLRNLEELLATLHSRSRNQHSRSAWYTHFASFRKSVSRLILLLSSNGVNKEEETERARQMVVVLRDHSVEEWYLAFTHLTADGQFAALAVTLLAALAEFAGMLGISRDD
ncbi:hypothetical protein NA57DRAFT_81023 [Rhizodiscina lignyota]|uniref:RNase MRP protein 1 RNA binding domain-containing protein n=1 Tax=Rhizodiscina lignyota TaxID=1504668 RepID=A0A9P4I790_9PEZI|nr:hypothetical protein NA57DRAFT_81023 [Rhizodiscina lignyota]